LNSFVVLGAQPLLVDTSGPPRRSEFLTDLGDVLTTGRISRIAITHADPDHTGGLVSVISGTPEARILANPMGQVKLMGDFGLSADHFVVAKPGDRLDLGDRHVTVHWVPLFDQPETMGFFDERSRVFFASDCFGAILPDSAVFADEINETTYRQGFVTWNRSNHPWVYLVGRTKFAAEIDRIRQLEPIAIASSHGPVIRQGLDRVFNWLEELPSGPRFAF
jgi:flavorubredoxin